MCRRALGRDSAPVQDVAPDSAVESGDGPGGRGGWVRAVDGWRLCRTERLERLTFACLTDGQNGAYIVKLLDLFDVCELDADPLVLHKLFDVFYAIRECTQ